MNKRSWSSRRRAGWCAAVATLAGVTLAAASGWAAPAQTDRSDAPAMHIDRLELVEAGFYDKTKVKVTKSTAAAGAAMGRVDELEDIKLLSAPPEVSARIGIGFGIRFRSFGGPVGGPAPLRSVWKIPEPGIRNPHNGNIYRQSVADFTTTIGGTHWRGYGFDEPWEVVPGTWTIEIWQGDRKLIEKSFTITTGVEGGGDPSPK
jgi:hypothetical protein